MKRDYSLDFLRIISMICVIIIHFSNYYCRFFRRIDEMTYLGGVVFNALARIAVPVFFMISGALLIGGKHDNKKYWSRIFKLTWALVIWNVIYYLWNQFHLGVNPLLFETAIKSMFDPTKIHLWFMYAIIGLYIVLPFVQSMFQNMDKEKEDLFLKLWFFFSGVVYLLRVLLGLYGIKVDIIYDVPLVQATYYFGYFAVGYILYKRFEKNKPNLNKLFCLGFLVSSLINIVCTFVVSMEKSKYYEAFFAYRSALIIIASLSVFALVLNNKEKLNGNERLIKFVSILAPASFGVYLLHIIPLNILTSSINILEFNSFIAIPLLSLLITFVSFVVIYVLRKVPGVSKFLGI